MNGSLLYQAYGVQGYSYAITEYEGNAIFLHLKTIVPQRCVCPHCGSLHVIRYGIVRRILHNLPFGSKPCNLSLQIQRFCCKECGGVWQSDIPFTHGEVSYTYRDNESYAIMHYMKMFAELASATLKQVADWFVWLASTLGRFNANELRRADHEVHDIADGRYDGRIQKYQQGLTR